MTRDERKRLAYWALDNLDDCIWQTVQAIADTDDPARAAELSIQLDQLDTGKLEVTSLLQKQASSSHI